MRTQIKILMVANYKAHSTNRAGAVKLSFTAQYDQIIKTVNLLQLLKENVDVYVRHPKVEEKTDTVKVGTFLIDGISIDKNGISTIKLMSVMDSVDTDAMRDIVTLDNLKVKFDGMVEVEESE